MAEKDKDSTLLELKKEIIKYGLIGILAFLIAIIGAEFSRYLSIYTDYKIYTKYILFISTIIFIFGVCILLKFRSCIKLYNKIKIE